MTSRAGQTISHYRLVEKIGEGGMGVVWKAQDLVLDRVVAIKFLPADLALDEERRSMFLQEAKLAASVSHARIAQVYELGREGDLDFIVMEYVDGRPLSKVLHGKRLPPEEIVDLGFQVAEGLARAHRKGLIHRDLKPANILVTSEHEAKIVDFGLAALFSQPGNTGTTATLNPGHDSQRTPIAGTLPYMSPEQVRGEQLDARSDIFSLGSVLYEMTTGQQPFRGGTPADIVRDILRCSPAPVSDVAPGAPMELRRIIEKAMSRHPAERYQTVDDAAVDLKRLTRDLASGSAPSLEELRSIDRVRRPSMLWFRGAVLLLLACVGAAAVWFVRTHGWNRGATAGGKRTVLILPMEVRGQVEGAEYVGRAFSEALAINLIQDANVRVLPVWEEPLEVAAKPRNSSALALSLGATDLVRGSLTRNGDSLQVNLSLTDAANNRLLWGVERGTLNSTLGSLASSLAHDLVPKLGSASTHMYDFVLNLGSPAMATNPLWGDALGALRREDATIALHATEQLVAHFPKEADALALRACALFYARGLPGNLAALTRVCAALDSLDPKNPTPECIRIEILKDSGGDQEAIERATRLIDRQDLTPAGRAWPLRDRAMARAHLRQFDAAIRDAQEALRLDPANYYNPKVLGFVYQEADQPEKALVYAREAAALLPSAWNEAQVASILDWMHRKDEAAESWVRVYKKSDQMAGCAAAAIRLVKASRPDEAREAADKATSLVPTDWGTYQLACYWALAGDKKQALRYLDRALQLGLADLDALSDPDLATLHGDAQFESFLSETRRRLAKLP